SCCRSSSSGAAARDHRPARRAASAGKLKPSRAFRCATEFAHRVSYPDFRRGPLMLPTLPIRAFRQRPPSARHWSAALALCALVAVAAAPASAITVIEYYNKSLDHYFLTPLAHEIDALDSGRIVGWGRTGFVFDGYATPGGAQGAVV